MIENGDSQNARFTFPAFRFIEQKNETVSSYYLHCITRLCERSTCAQFKQCGERKKRSVELTTPSPDGVSDSTYVSSQRITTQTDSFLQGSKDEALSGSNNVADASVGLGVAVGILTIACVCMIGIAIVFYKRVKPHLGSSKMLPN
ncbi:hypothetical protein AAFF_G00417050 [Aldrovandia affinis]|uniref:ZP domain-containing protein n=1 Tax=Aldrovandia affinis TaxID=143900 RepID=A0AAD7SAW8_9TELE|nr:hypothetical protein AAFF_G00417050 [Aldrovandia affinis]